MIAQLLLDEIERVIGRFEFAESNARWVRNIAEDKPAMERALAELQKRMASPKLGPVENPRGWLEAAYRRNMGKAVAA